jgi:hypothetical protein
MQNLELRDVCGVFYKQDKARKYSVYYDGESNNIILFSPYEDCTIDSVCNGISKEAYSYLVKELNSNRRLLVDWSQISGTTSDYTLFYDFPNESLRSKTYKDISNYIKDLRIDYGSCAFKYIEVRNGIPKKIETRNLQ